MALWRCRDLSRHAPDDHAASASWIQTGSSACSCRCRPDRAASMARTYAWAGVFLSSFLSCCSASRSDLAVTRIADVPAMKDEGRAPRRWPKPSGRGRMPHRCWLARPHRRPGGGLANGQFCAVFLQNVAVEANHQHRCHAPARLIFSSCSAGFPTRSAASRSSWPAWRSPSSAPSAVQG